MCVFDLLLDSSTSLSLPSTPLSSPSGSVLSVSISSSDSETPRPSKRKRGDEEDFQSSSARDVSFIIVAVLFLIYFKKLSTMPQKLDVAFIKIQIFL